MLMLLFYDSCAMLALYVSIKFLLTICRVNINLEFNLSNSFFVYFGVEKIMSEFCFLSCYCPISPQCFMKSVEKRLYVETVNILSNT